VKDPYYKYYAMKSKMKKRGMSMMPKEDFEWFQYHAREFPFCYYCGIKLDFINNTGMDGATIDRIDPEIGYLEENCVVACRRCNIIKGNWFTAEEMLQIAEDYQLEDR